MGPGPQPQPRSAACSPVLTANIPALREVGIQGDEIRLGQLLKLSGLAETGAAAKALLLDHAVTVNGEPETRRGRRVRRGDIVALGDEVVRVA